MSAEQLPQTMDELKEELAADGWGPGSIGWFEDPDFRRLEGNISLRRRPDGRVEVVRVGRGDLQVDGVFDSEREAVQDIATSYLYKHHEEFEMTEKEWRRAARRTRWRAEWGQRMSWLPWVK